MTTNTQNSHVAVPGWQAAADWLRNNYQDHPNIASLCDALVAAAPALEAPAAVEFAMAYGGRRVPAYGKRGDPVLLYPDDLARMLAAAPQAPAAPGKESSAALNLEAAAKKLAELFDYPWEHMPAEGRQNMRKNVEAVLLAAAAKESP